jgi:hypothetical protein
MANAAALISLATAYEKRFGRATLAALVELAQQDGGIADAASAEALASAGDGHAGPVIAHLLDRIAALKHDVIDALAQHPVLPVCAAADVAPCVSEAPDLPVCAAADAAPCVSEAPVLAVCAAVDAAPCVFEAPDLPVCAAADVAPCVSEPPVEAASAWQSERGDMPLLDWIRKKARKDMLVMSEQDLAKHLDDLDRIRQAPWGAVTVADSSERQRRELENQYRRLRNELEAAVHIGWLLQEQFPGVWAHADTEAMLLERMTPYECAQYEVRKENARRRQEFRRRKPGVFNGPARSAQDSPLATTNEAIDGPRA